MKTILSTCLGAAASAVMLLLMPVAASGQNAPLDGTLKKIADDGVVVIGYREASIPFSYYDDAKNPVGYSMDLTAIILDRIKAKLGKPDLQVRKLPITSQNRISLLQNGTIDFECTTTTHNASREQQVDFSNTFFAIGTRLLTRKSTGITDFPDLKGQNVVVGAGTTSEILLRKMNADQGMGMNIISAKDHAESFLMLSTGRAKAMMMDDALLAGERAKTKDASEFIITGTPQSREAYGCMVRKGDAQLKKLLDETLAELQTSGKAVAIYDKWFRSPIPPRGLNLDFALSDDMKALFAAPNDKILN
ncbi:MAG: glutamate/aspartate ABC transporter substrate-binding protein [Bosea sp.]|uniref:glutamate/aspartate ABC transporter substrate-binding protein n=1 Tax=Bosea sp. (in: a-proteobacteria) TaxID=1871050 RepID=UPI001AC4DFB0|nr:glutamate/aspartate ABC transporter substrate-binding protein [Bosea sp. (in: a-proteobacteria)]MBN9451290.1 glutamate/aspartate ABC transporter substrate-binding protein [Bosea sp. (in: a-proteobacteria)]